jgi:ubiquinone/menaquinone biosynthesis C-methylase UbiE
VPALLVEPDAPATRERIAALDADMRRHPMVMAAMSLATLRWMPAERARLLREAELEPGDFVLDHCTGPGGNLSGIAREVGARGHIAAVDLSGLVVGQARARARRRGLQVDVHQADALALPYADAVFDALIHFGAINQFAGDQKQAIDEILRVVRPGGRIMIMDEGIAEERRDTLWGRALVARTPLFAARPPLHLLPASVEVRVDWIVRGMFYRLRFRKPA